MKDQIHQELSSRRSGEPMSKLQQLKERALQNPEVCREYDAQAEEFELFDSLLKMCAATGLTQKQLAKRIALSSGVSPWRS